MLRGRCDPDTFKAGQCRRNSALRRALGRARAARDRTTKYYATPTEQFRLAGISTVIWAKPSAARLNLGHARCCACVETRRDLVEIEHRVAPVGEFSAWLAMTNWKRRKTVTFSQKHSTRHYSAASQGQLGELTADKPKCMVDVRGQPLLQRLIATLASSGVRDVTVCGAIAKRQ